jgi:hypothetical protein
VEDVNQLAGRYVAVWNQPDPARRRAAIAEVWTDDAVHLLEPPVEAREAAAGLAINPVFAARGHAELLPRVTRAYEDWVAPGQYTFRERADAARVADLVKFHWEMVTPDGEVAAVGLEIVLLAADGRIRLDYQLIER